MDFVNSLTTIEKVCLWASTTLPVAVGAYKAARLVERKARGKIVEALHPVIAASIDGKIKPLLDKLEEIHTQITVNGNTRNTLRDKFSRIEEDVHLIVSLQRANMENATQARFECDATGRCIWVNESLCALFGQSVNTMTDADGNGWLRSIEEANDVFHDWSEAVKNKTPYQREYTVRNQRTNKRTKCRAVGIPMFGKDGATVRVWNGSVNPIEELA